MEIKKLNEKLERLLEFQFNEMTLIDTPCFGEAESILDAYEQLKIKKRGCYIVPDKIRIRKLGTQEDIDLGYIQSIQKDVECTISFPIKLAWGEYDIYKKGKFKRGHGITHGEQGHDSFKEALNDLSEILKRKVAVLDKRSPNENYIIDTNKYRFAFGIKDGYAILITGLRK